MAGLLDFLSMLSGSGQQPQGLLSQGDELQSNPLRDLSLGLLKANQPSPYKKGWGGLLADATLNADDMQRQRQQDQIKMMQSGQMPSAIQEYQYYSKLPPEEQKRYLEVKRQQQWLNTGDSFQNPVTGGMIPKGLPPQDQPAIRGAQATATEQGKTLVNNQNNLPDALATASNALQQIKELRGQPGLSDAVGAKNLFSGAATMAVGLDPIAGTDAANFETRRKQLVGGTFLQAYNTLKGGGQITEVEGQKAQDAIARMSTAQSENEFNKALDDYEAVIKSGVDRARLKAGIKISPDAPAGTLNSGNITSYQDYFK